MRILIEVTAVEIVKKISKSAFLFWMFCSCTVFAEKLAPNNASDKWLSDLARCVPGALVEDCIAPFVTAGFDVTQSFVRTTEKYARLNLNKNSNYIEFTIPSAEDHHIAKVEFSIGDYSDKERHQLVAWMEKRTKDGKPGLSMNDCGCNLTGPSWTDSDEKNADVTIVLSGCVNVHPDMDKKPDYKKYYLSYPQRGTAVCFFNEETKAKINDGKWAGAIMGDFVTSDLFKGRFSPKNKSSGK